INALAYTRGNHVVFSKGQYQPQSDAGKKLLAHELAHVGQQRNFEIRRKLPFNNKLPQEKEPAINSLKMKTKGKYEDALDAINIDYLMILDTIATACQDWHIIASRKQPISSTLLEIILTIALASVSAGIGVMITKKIFSALKKDP